MIGKPGPFRVIAGDSKGCVDSPIPAPRRRFACPNYTKCLNVAAALNWDNFTCRGCCGQVDENTLWRAQKALRESSGEREDFKVAARICDLPEINIIDSKPPDNTPPSKPKQRSRNRRLNLYTEEEQVSPD